MRTRALNFTTLLALYNKKITNFTYKLRLQNAPSYYDYRGSSFFIYPPFGFHYRLYIYYFHIFIYILFEFNTWEKYIPFFRYRDNTNLIAQWSRRNIDSIFCKMLHYLSQSRCDFINILQYCIHRVLPIFCIFIVACLQAEQKSVF